MPYNWSFYHLGPIGWGGEEGGILLIHYSMIYVYGLTYSMEPCWFIAQQNMPTNEIELRIFDSQLPVPYLIRRHWHPTLATLDEFPN